MSFLTLLAVFLGGGSGAVCRYALGRFIAGHYSGIFPIGTFLINITGCFTLGLLATVLANSYPNNTVPTALLATGFLGGYTTFSTYALESVLLYLDGSIRPALTNALGSVLVGLAAAALGAGVGHVV